MLSINPLKHSFFIPFCSDTQRFLDPEGELRLRHLVEKRRITHRHGYPLAYCVEIEPVVVLHKGPAPSETDIDGHKKEDSVPGLPEDPDDGAEKDEKIYRHSDQSEVIEIIQDGDLA